ncbi:MULTISPECIES: ATP-dependent helicase HrpB [unclassified Sphingopyxis]|uniref:ATP-dependent helicase HrpB n=1 Tax=unclassified Sphingopyxis TaxID=2614943 RepID=UPI0007312F4F|nr:MULTISPECIES: ATP-dependent helicase HrpB [unclassified Sphingopyxis]KTE24371.1 ATP-dependent helicase [Sphingopyxis sp. H057]KTE50900.1 ATP-dependent helicase [Sphingopyxis sp. H071]KTE52042.1 ATP-dependent helicase [Sphingopyxis sp. H073]KTE59679.1 ATP-dependent helicase [Sphingopyxis sp. H107]KTE62242.1 ATP-dependent helicase [Sphingopyxis sp. H100]
MTQPLPIDAVLPDIMAALVLKPNVVVVAPPGAGKTTRVAPAMLDQPWCKGTVWLLSPRRLAARAAAERIAEEMGEAVGGKVGYATRLDSKQSAATRLLVMTPGLFRNRILADPELHGVSAVLFDEVHERSLDGDFALALAIDAQQGLRDDLRLVAMSATLDGARFGALLGGAPVVKSEGKSWPLDLRHIGRRAEDRLEASVLAAVRHAMADEADGDMLAFLPGAADIERAAAAVEAAGLPLVVHRLHGQIDPAQQRKALVRDPDGGRKLILATSIAETSLTIEGVRIVIDAGLSRRPRFDKAAGIARLVTERASQASATQRAGRAARQGPGVAYRLWEAAATAGMPPFDPPEIHENDLMPVVLDCASWGIIDPRQLGWLDPPSPAAIAEAKMRLRAIGALGDDGRITAHGKALASIPLPVPLAHMLLDAARAGEADLAAKLAVLLTEPGLGGRGVDVEARLGRWQAMRGDRSEGAWRLARRLAELGKKRASGESKLGERSVGGWIATAWPDRVARRRAGQRGDYLSAGGRAYKLDPLDPLANSEWLAIADAQGHAAGVRILGAAPIGLAEVETIFADQIESRSASRYDAEADRVDHRRERRLGAIALSSGQTARSGGAEDDVAVRIAAVREKGLGLIGWGPVSQALRQRASFAGLDALSAPALSDSLDIWLAPLLGKSRGLRDIGDQRLADALSGLLDWPARQLLEKLAPADFITPAGSRHAIDYGADGGPTVSVRVQEMFGLARHPVIGDPPIPLVLALTSPAHRPIQTSRDIVSFWSGSWSEVAKEMRGRYPKHSWPDDPANARATLLTKAAQARRDTQ